MSLSTDGIWKAGVWATTVWTDCVWYEPHCAVAAPAPAPSSAEGGGAYGWSYHKIRKDKLIKDDEEIMQMIALALPELIRRYRDG